MGQKRQYPSVLCKPVHFHDDMVSTWMSKILPFHQDLNPQLGHEQKLLYSSVNIIYCYSVYSYFDLVFIVINFVLLSLLCFIKTLKHTQTFYFYFKFFLFISVLVIFIGQFKHFQLKQHCSLISVKYFFFYFFLVC